MYSFYLCTNCNYIILLDEPISVRTLFSKAECFKCTCPLRRYTSEDRYYQEVHNLSKYCSDEEVSIKIIDMFTSHKTEYVKEKGKFIDLNTKSASELLEIKKKLNLIL